MSTQSISLITMRQKSTIIKYFENGCFDTFVSFIDWACTKYFDTKLWPVITIFTKTEVENNIFYVEKAPFYNHILVSWPMDIIKIFDDDQLELLFCDEDCAHFYKMKVGTTKNTINSKLHGL